MIEGVLVAPLKIIGGEKGKVMHMMRSDCDFFTNFGEVYFSFTKPGRVKGWKKHLKQTQHFAVPIGNLKLVIYDDRKKSNSNGETQELNIGIDNYQLVRIPPEVWYAFKAVGDCDAMIVNCTDMPHDPDESIQTDISDNSIPYSWD